MPIIEADLVCVTHVADPITTICLTVTQDALTLLATFAVAVVAEVLQVLIFDSAVPVSFNPRGRLLRSLLSHARSKSVSTL